MGVLGAVVEVSVLAVFHARQDLALRCAITFQLVRNDHPWYVGQALEQLAEEFLRGLLVSTALHETIQPVAVLIHGPPQIMTFLIDREKDLVSVPLVARPRAATTELIRIGLPKLPAPFPDGFIRHEDPTGEQELFDIAIAQAEAIVQPDTMTNNLSGKTVVFVVLRGGGRGHAWLPLHLFIRFITWSAS